MKTVILNHQWSHTILKQKNLAAFINKSEDRENTAPKPCVYFWGVAHITETEGKFVVLFQQILNRIM